MPSLADVLSAFRTELVDQGLVRKASQSTPAGKPPMFVQLDAGAPAPGEREGVENDAELMLTIFAGGDFPSFPDGAIRRSTIDLRYRAAPNKARRAFDLDAEICAAICDQTGTGFAARYDWTMGGLYVIESRVWAALGTIRTDADQGSDFVTKFYIETRTE